MQTQMDYQAPSTIDAALQLIDDQGYQLLGLGSSALRSTDIKPKDLKLVSLRKVEGLAAVQVASGSLQIGATATFDDLLRSGLLGHYPALEQALRATPEPHQRNTCTLGGAVHDGGACFAPVLAALVAYDATAELVSRRGSSSRTFEMLGSGREQQQVASGNLLSKVVVSATGLPVSAYVALDPIAGHRPFQGIAVALNAPGGVIQMIRLVLAGFSGYPMRLSTVETSLIGSALTTEQIEQACGKIDESALQSSTHSSAYHLHLVRALIRKALLPLIGSAQGTSA